MRGNKPDTWFQDGPLGLSNYRQQLGRSFELGVPVEKLKQTLIFASATQHTRAGQGLAPRAAGDSAASLVQVTCSYRGEGETNDARPLPVRGQIDWGTDGHQCTAYFDWLNGTVLQVAASFVRVTAEVVGNMAGSDEAPTYSETAIATVGATIGYGSANRSPPTYTQQVRLEQEGMALPSAVIAIPRFARRLWWYGPVPTSAAWAAGPSAALEFAQVDPLSVNTRQPYERPGPATHLRVVGNEVAATLNTLCWELSL